jgi:hypothetical protein
VSIDDLVGDIERDQAATVLSEAYSAGKLTGEEFHERMEAAMGARTEGDLDRTLTGLGGCNAIKPGRKFRPRYAVVAASLVALIAGGGLVWSQVSGGEETKKANNNQKKTVTITVETESPAPGSGSQSPATEDITKLYKATRSKMKVNCSGGFCYSDIYLTIKNVDSKVHEFWLDYVGLDSRGVIVYEGTTSTGKLKPGEAKKLQLSASDNESPKNKVVKIQVKPIRLTAWAPAS